MKLYNLRTKFLNFCLYSKANYYSQICDININQNLLPAVWGVNHCEFIPNEKIICSKCNGQIYIDLQYNILKCLKCKIYKNTNNIERFCAICKVKYTSNIYIYNPMESIQINNIIKDALSSKNKPYPKNLPCCKNLNNKLNDFFHNKNCKGKIYTFNYNEQAIIICEKCKKLYNYENFNWICPSCNNCFQSNNLKFKENGQKIGNNFSAANQIKKNNNIDRILKISQNIKQKNNQYENSNDSRHNNENNKTKDIKPNNQQKLDNFDNNGKINLFNFVIKERERKPIRLFKSKDILEHYKINENGKILTDVKKINHLELKNENNENDSIHKKKRFLFRRYINLKEKNNQDIMIKNEKMLNEMKNSYNNINLINNKDSKKSPIENNKEDNKQIKVNKIQINISENMERQRSFILTRRKNILNEDKNNIYNTENKDKLKEDSKNKNIKISLINQIHKNRNEDKVNNSIKSKIKNYLLKSPREKYKSLKTENNKNNISIITNKDIKDNEKIHNKGNIKYIKIEEKKMISSKEKIDNNNFIKPETEQISIKNSEKLNQIIKKLDDKDNNNNMRTNNNIEKLKPMKNIITNSGIKQNISNFRFSHQQNTQVNKFSKKERIKDNSLPKKIVKLNKPADIIEPENIDTNKDFPIDDPYIKNNLDIYEEIQEKLKEIMYKKKLPMFNPDLYKIEMEIGEGTNGIIFQAMNIRSGKRYAIKKIITNDIIALKYIKKEFDLVYEVEHPNILSIYGICIKCLDYTTFSLSVLMDLGDTDWEIEINEHYNKNQFYTENELMSILKQLVSGLKYLQKEKKIAHRDIKPENIIIFKNNIYKLGDFGEAKGTKNADKLSTLRGTDTYMSPILYKGLQLAQEDVIHDIYKSDVFSLGYSFLFAASLNHDILNEIRDLEKIEDIKKVLYHKMKPRYSENFINIILRMINPDERKRIDFISLDKMIK